MFEAVIFDWDGTLADTKKAILRAFHQTLKENNYGVSDEFIASRIGIGAAETFKEILKTAKQPYDQEIIDELVARKSELEIEFTSEIVLFDGALELLEALNGKVKVGLASMNNRLVISHLIRALKVEKYFQVVLTAESITHSKPDPEIFIKCAQKLGANLGGCVVLEDSVFGVEAAKSASMACIAVTTGQYSRGMLKRKGANLVVSSLKSSEIVPFIFGK